MNAERILLDVLLSRQTDNIVIYGAGQNGIKLWGLLRKYNYHIDNFCDSNSEKWNTCIEGVVCINRAALCHYKSSVLILVTPYNSDETVRELIDAGFRNVIECAALVHIIEYCLPRKSNNTIIGFRPFNCYDSPYPDYAEITSKEKEIFEEEKTVMDIDWNEEEQRNNLLHMSNLRIDSINWPQEKDNNLRYYCKNSWFCYKDAYLLQCMIRIAKPKRIIEVGSGFSTAVMLDTNDAYFNNEIIISCIEPNVQRVKSIMKENDNIKINECCLQDISYNYFEELKAGDILFIDSSHVSKINSDVNYIFFEILPRLQVGVYVHFHDIFYPFIYPKRWIYEGRAYNELYMLRAFLQNNRNYSIQYFNNMMTKKYDLKNDADLDVLEFGSSIWLRKEKA